MPNLVAKAVLTLVAGAMQPLAPPQNSPNLLKVYDTEKRIGQLDQQLREVNPQFHQVPAKPFFDLTVPDPAVIDTPIIINIKPHGRSFRFNGLTVYVEPIEMTFLVATKPRN